MLILADVFGVVLTALALCYRALFWREPAHDPKKPCFPKWLPQQQRQTAEGWIAQLREIPYERVQIVSYDGLTLVGRYYALQEGAPVEIQFHGYRSDGIRDFCGGFFLALAQGHNVLQVDQRAHGESGGNSITFGAKERQDCCSWAHYAAARFGPGCRILLSGVSMGAATVLMAAGLELPGQVKGILADCGYTSARNIIGSVAKKKHVPVWAATFVACSSARLFGHFSLASADAEQAVRRSHVPILFLHGTSDRFVPCTMSIENWRACSGPKRLALFPGAGHATSYLCDMQRYRQLVFEFCENCLQQTDS